MTRTLLLAFLLGTTCSLQIAFGAPSQPEGEVVFHDEFNSRLADGWSWIREDRPFWRVGPAGLEVRVQPGNEWGGANNAKNVLVRSIPSPTEAPIEIAVTFSNAPTARWEQANLVWFYDEGNMVKLGEELVTERLTIVMGREEGDRARTIAIVPLDANRVELRLQGFGNRVRGQFRTAPWSNWRDVGECDLPVKDEPKASLHFYNGPTAEEHWVRVNNFSVRRLPADAGNWTRVRIAEDVHRSAGFGTISIPGDFALFNLVVGPESAKPETDQHIYVHRDGSYGWSWDNRTSVGKASVCGVTLGETGLFRSSDSPFPHGLTLRTIKSVELDLDVVTRLDIDQGTHNLCAVIALTGSATGFGPPTHKIAIWFDWYGKGSDVQSLNDGYHNYGYVPGPAGEVIYRIKGLRGAPPKVNLKAFIDDAVKRVDDGKDWTLLGICVGNEVWKGSRGGTLVNRLDLKINDQQFSSIPAKPGQ